jgi:hypothetical protein
MQSQPAFSNSGIGERYCLVVETSTVAISLSTGARCCRSYESDRWLLLPRRKDKAISRRVRVMVPGEENRLEENRDNSKEWRGLACNRQRLRDPQLCRQFRRMLISHSLRIFDDPTAWADFDFDII